MSAVATLPFTRAELAAAPTAELIAPADGSKLPIPRNSPVASTVAFLFMGLGSAIMAYLSCLALMFTMSYSVTLGAWALVALFSVWAPIALFSALIASARGEFG